MIKTFFLTLLTLAVGLGVYLFFYLGVYKPVDVRLEKRGPFEVVFKQHIGPYHTIGASIREVENWAQTHGLNCPQTFGEYLDNPEAVDEDRLRSHGGCILTSAPATVPSEYQYQHRPERSYAVGRFEGSPAIGPYTVYPKLRKFLDEHRLKSSSPVIEIYTVNGDKVTTEYLFAIDQPAALAPPIK
jgi:DNA gyrase inhibitor GyrI